MATLTLCTQGKQNFRSLLTVVMLEMPETENRLSVGLNRQGGVQAFRNAEPFGYLRIGVLQKGGDEVWRITEPSGLCDATLALVLEKEAAEAADAVYYRRKLEEERQG